MLIGDQDVHLTLNEFKIVALLGKYAGKVLTYDYLIKQIWGAEGQGRQSDFAREYGEHPPQDREESRPPEYIFTEIGVGYRMLENDA